MFSGIVTERGEVASTKDSDQNWVLGIKARMFEDPAMKIGDSVSNSGVCLTVVCLEDGVAYFDLASETRRCTTLGGLKPGDSVNLERSLRVGETIDGHFVQGHVDAVSEVVAVKEEENTVRFEFELPDKVAPLVAPKGSVSIDGVSLTVGEVGPESFSVYIIPHTLEITTFGLYETGTKVNIEADCIARYVERLTQCYRE